MEFEKRVYQTPELTRHQRLQKVTLGTVSGPTFQEWADGNPRAAANSVVEEANAEEWALKPDETVEKVSYGYGKPTVRISNKRTDDRYTVPLASRTRPRR